MKYKPSLCSNKSCNTYLQASSHFNMQFQSFKSIISSMKKENFVFRQLIEIFSNGNNTHSQVLAEIIHTVRKYSLCEIAICKVCRLFQLAIENTRTSNTINIIDLISPTRAINHQKISATSIISMIKKYVYWPALGLLNSNDVRKCYKKK